MVYLTRSAVQLKCLVALTVLTESDFYPNWILNGVFHWFYTGLKITLPREWHEQYMAQSMAFGLQCIYINPNKFEIIVEEKCSYQDLFIIRIKIVRAHMRALNTACILFMLTLNSGIVLWLQTAFTVAVRMTDNNVKLSLLFCR